MSTDQLRPEAAAEDEAAALEAYRDKQVAQLDRLFRHAGEAAETRLIYQAVLDFHMAQRRV